MVSLCNHNILELCIPRKFEAHGFKLDVAWTVEATAVHQKVQPMQEWEYSVGTPVKVDMASYACSHSYLISSSFPLYALILRLCPKKRETHCRHPVGNAVCRKSQRSDLSLVCHLDAIAPETSVLNRVAEGPHTNNHSMCRVCGRAKDI